MLGLDPAKDYAITATASGLSSDYAFVRGDRPAYIRRHLQLALGKAPAGVVQGVLLRDDGQRTAGLVRAFPADRREHEIYVASTDEAGRYRLDLAQGKYMLIGTAADSTFVVERVEIGAAQQELRLKLRPPATPLPPSTIDELRRGAVAVDLSDTTPPAKEAGELPRALCSARVVGIGESTHGSSEFTRFRAAIWFRLARDCGYSALLLELDMSEVAEMDDFVQTGDGDPKALLVRTETWPYSHEEMRNLLVRLRDYNRNASRRIHVLGVDAYDGGMPARGLLRYTQDLHPGVGTTAEKSLELFLRPDFDSFYRKASAQERAELRTALALAQSFLAQVGARKGARDQSWKRASLHLQALVALEAMVSARADKDYGERDRWLAKNTQWLLDVYLPGAKAVVGAHNGHLLLSRPVWKVASMGDLLADAFGDEYVSVGVFFGHGTFMALPVQHGGLGSLKTFSIAAPIPDGLDGALAQVGLPAFLVDMRPLSTETKAWLANDLRHHELGSMYWSDEGTVQHTAPGVTYHMLGYVNEVTAIQPLE